MKKSQIVTLCLITSALATCGKKEKQKDQRVFMRSDTTAPYSRSHSQPHNSNLMWFYAFRPYHTYGNGSYHRAGFYSDNISHHSNVGTNSVKSSTTTRGGFGGYSSSHSSFHSSSSHISS